MVMRKTGRNYSDAALTHDEALRLLDNQMWLSLATRDESGAIWNTPTHFVRIGDSIFFDESEGSIILENIKANSLCCAVVDTGVSYDDVQGVILQADAVPVFELSSNEKEKIAKLIADKYSKLSNGKSTDPEFFSGREIIELNLLHEPEYISWAYGKRMH